MYDYLHDGDYESFHQSAMGLDPEVKKVHLATLEEQRAHSIVLFDQKWNEHSKTEVVRLFVDFVKMCDEMRWEDTELHRFAEYTKKKEEDMRG